MILFRAAFGQALRYHFSCIIRAEVAQVVERSPEKAGVGGSTPSLGTTLPQSRFAFLTTILAPPRPPDSSYGRHPFPLQGPFRVQEDRIALGKQGRPKPKDLKIGLINSFVALTTLIMI